MYYRRRKVGFRKYRGHKRRGGRLRGARPFKRRRTAGKFRASRKYNRGGSYGILSKVKYVKMTYVNAIDFPSSDITGLGTLIVGGNNIVLRVNSIFDPNYSSTGAFNNKIAGYTFWSNLYNKYRVVKARIKMRIRQHNSQNVAGDHVPPPPIVCGYRMDDDASISGYTGWEQFQGDRNVKFKVFQGGLDAATVKPCTLTATYRPRDWDIDIGNTTSNMGSHPTKTVFFVPWFQNMTKDSSASAVHLNLYQHVTFWVRLSDPKDVTTLASSAMIVQGGTPL